jgi:G1/S-specific cyclin PLC1
VPVYFTMDFANRHQDQDAALKHFVCTPVTRDMITHLADIAQEVIQCETFPTTEHVQLQQVPTPPTPLPALSATDIKIPCLEQFITSLVINSNVQVPTIS